MRRSGVSLKVSDSSATCVICKSICHKSCCFICKRQVCENCICDNDKSRIILQIEEFNLENMY